MKAYSVSKFLKYILFSSHKRGHGIHSPFIFSLVLKVFRDKINPDIVNTIETIRKKLVSDHRIIEVTDFGVGSEMRKGNLRRISEIVKYSSVPMRYGKFLAGLSAEYGKTSIIEFGTSLGISTMYMAVANPDAIVYTMEGCPAVSEIARNNFAEAGIKNVKSLTGSFEKLLPEIEDLKISPGLVFIDGDHRKKSLIEYFGRMVNISDGNTVIVIDDIYHSAEMGEAWKEIKKNEKVSFTVDIFRMGIVFFREGMTRFDYIIRY